MRVGELLKAAQALLDEPVQDTATTWPSGAAVLIRQAIEETLDVFWKYRAPEMQRATMKEQWLALPAYLGRDPVVGRAEYAWAALSEACHQRGYDVGLTEGELRELLETARDLGRRVAAALGRDAPARDKPIERPGREVQRGGVTATFRSTSRPKSDEARTGTEIDA